MPRTATATIELTDSGCVVARIDAGVKQSLADAQENLSAAVTASGGQPRPLLIDISRAEPLEAPVRHFYSGERLGRGFLALALVVGASPLGRMMGNVYLSIARPGIPTRLFADEPTAIGWLREWLAGTAADGQ
jgi:hypothetical protein